MAEAPTRYLYTNRVVPLNEVNGVEAITSGKTNALLDAGTILAEGGTIGGGGGSSHTHPNKTIIDGIGIDNENLIYFNNDIINIPLIQEDW